MTMLLLAAISFVGTHFLLSHPLPRLMVKVVGEGVFHGIYSLVAAATLLWMVLAYRSAPQTALLWPVGGDLRAAALVRFNDKTVVWKPLLLVRHRQAGNGPAALLETPRKGAYVLL